MRHYVLDPVSLAPVPVGVPGELFISGPGVARGYLGRPELTAAAFLFNPYKLPGDSDAYNRMYRTGDNVMWLPSGIQRSALRHCLSICCQESPGPHDCQPASRFGRTKVHL
jgi:non-ribosomal peptide synthetase component F